MKNKSSFKIFFLLMYVDYYTGGFGAFNGDLVSKGVNLLRGYGVFCSFIIFNAMSGFIIGYQLGFAMCFLGLESLGSIAKSLW